MGKKKQKRTDKKNDKNKSPAATSDAPRSAPPVLPADATPEPAVRVTQTVAVIQLKSKPATPALPAPKITILQNPNFKKRKLEELNKLHAECLAEYDEIYALTNLSPAFSPEQVSAVAKALPDIRNDLILGTIEVPHDLPADEANLYIQQAMRRYQTRDRKITQHKEKLERLRDEIDELFDKTKETDEHYNDVVLLKIKRVIISGHDNKRVCFNKGGEFASEAAAYQYRGAVGVYLFHLTKNLGNLRFAHDTIFQAEMSGMFQFLHEITSHEPNEMENLTLVEAAFITACPDNFMKFSSLYHFVEWERKRLNVESTYKISRNFKQEFSALSKVAIQQFRTRKDNDKKSTIEFILTNLMTFAFEENTRLGLLLGFPAHVDLTHPDAPSAIEALVNKTDDKKLLFYLKVSQPSLVKLVEQPMRLLADFDAVSEGSPEVLGLVLKTTRLYTTINQFYVDFYFCTIEKFLKKLPEKARQAEAALAALKSQISSILKNQHIASFSDEFSNWLGIFKEYFELMTDYEKQILDSVSTDKQKHLTATAELSQLMVEWDKQQPKEPAPKPSKPAPKVNKTKKSAPPVIDSDNEEEDKRTAPSAESNPHLAAADAARVKGQTDEAIKKFHLALEEGKHSADTNLQLRSMDGILRLNALNLIGELDSLWKKLRNRNHAFKSFTPDELEKLDEDLERTDKQQADFVKLYHQFADTIRNMPLHDRKKISDGLISTLDFCNRYIDKMQNTTTQIHDEYLELRQRLQQRRRNVILSVGRREAIRNELNLAKMTEDEIFKLGEPIYKQIGKEKRSKGKEISHASKERLFIDNLKKKFDSLADTAKKINVLHINDLPESFEVAFSAVAQIPGDVYLVGSQVEKLLREELTEQGDDFDFVFLHSNAQAVITAGFHHAGIDEPLYFNKNDTMAIDCQLSSAKNLEEDMRTRDFTACAVYYQKGKGFIDPTGLGIADAQSLTLRMIGDPAVRLKEDPVRLLRAMKKILKDGYKPEEKLQAALKNYQLEITEKQRQHLNAVIKKHLRSKKYNPVDYVALIQKYGLLKKLFGIKEEEPNKALWDLESKLNIRTRPVTNPATLFTPQKLGSKQPVDHLTLARSFAPPTPSS